MGGGRRGVRDGICSPVDVVECINRVEIPGFFVAIGWPLVASGRVGHGPSLTGRTLRIIGLVLRMLGAGLLLAGR